MLIVLIQPLFHCFVSFDKFNNKYYLYISTTFNNQYLSNNIFSNKDFYSVLIVSSFFSLWLSTQISAAIESNIAYIMILTVGILHGSNDIMLINHSLKSNTNISSFSIFVIYVLMVASVAVLFYFLPFIALSLFVIFSSYHFGEQHLEDKISGSKVLKSMLYTAYGMLIFSLIFIENLKDVEVVMRNLTGKIIPNSWIETMLVTSSLLLITLTAYLFTRKVKPNIQIIRELFYVLLLYLVFKTSSLIFGFAIYFVLWHSIPSILDQTKFLSGGYTFKTMLEYLKTAFVYWLISITGLVVAYYYLSESLFNSIIFIVLFAVTAPHVWVMNRMKQ